MLMQFFVDSLIIVILSKNFDFRTPFCLKRSLETEDPGPLEKVDPMPNFTALAKNSSLTNLMVVISNTTIAF